MDHFLILGSSPEECQQATQMTLQLLQEYGWKINMEKSQTTPTQTLEYIGFTLDTKTATVRLQANKLKALLKRLGTC